MPDVGQLRAQAQAIQDALDDIRATITTIETLLSIPDPEPPAAEPEPKPAPEPETPAAEAPAADVETTDDPA